MSKISSILAIIIILTSSVLVSVYLRLELPDTTSNIEIPSLGNQVTVTQDQFGIYHVNAKTQKSGLMAEGYLMARERLWQMDFYRRQAEGNLSQIFYQLDKSVLDLDYSLRALGLYRIAARDWKTFSNETQSFYQEFADGVNLFIKGNENKLPIEFGILNYHPALWTPIDSVAILKLMAFGLNSDGGGEALIGKALSEVNITWSDPVAYPVPPKPVENTTTTNTTSNTTTTSTLTHAPVSRPIQDYSSSFYNFLTSEFSFENTLGSNN